MPKTVEQNSIRSILFKTIMLITAICLLLSLSISTYLSTQEQKKQLISKLVLVSEIIAFDAMPSLLNKNRPAEERRLKLLQHVGPSERREGLHADRRGPPGPGCHGAGDRQEVTGRDLGSKKQKINRSTLL